MYILYCGTKGQTYVKQNYSSDVRDDTQYKTNVQLFLQNYLANMRVTRGTTCNRDSSITDAGWTYSVFKVDD